MPLTTPAVKSSFSVSTSEVTRVMRRPAGISIEERDRQPLQMAEQLQPQVAHDVLAKQRGEPGLPVFGAELDQQRRTVKNDCDTDVVVVVLRDGDVDDALRQKRPDELEGTLDEEEEERDCDERSVRRGEGQEPSHQAAVVSLSERLFFVKGQGWRGHADFNLTGRNCGTVVAMMICVV